ncbi:MAG: hypothetical protein AB7T27_02800 [Kiritimatiellia bacterium]
MRQVIAALALVALCGCGTMPGEYKPSQTGPIGAPEIVSGLSVSIASRSDQVAFGQQIIFNVTVSNASDMIFWLPQEPFIRFTWTHANGRRDMIIVEHPAEQYFTAQDAVKFYPGETHVSQTRIPTGYFPVRGITEFKAIYKAPRNTNPDLRPFWNGEARSNRYGVDIRSRKYNGGH